MCSSDEYFLTIYRLYEKIHRRQILTEAQQLAMINTKTGPPCLWGSRIPVVLLHCILTPRGELDLSCALPWSKYWLQVWVRFLHTPTLARPAALLHLLCSACDLRNGIISLQPRSNCPLRTCDGQRAMVVSEVVVEQEPSWKAALFSSPCTGYH